VVSSISQVKAYQQAVSSSKIALEATEAGYDVGTRTAVDVLLSRQRYFDALSNYSKARSTYILNTLTLKQITGSLTPEAIHQVNGWLSKITSIQ
jgi:outer membrane protein